MKRKLDEHRAKARADFRAAVMKQGEEQSKRECTKNLLRENVAPEIIARCTELSLEEVLEIQKTL